MNTFCLFTAAVVSLIGISAAQEVVLERTEPDPQQLPCPQQRVQYRCRLMVPASTLIWTLPTGVELEFGVLRVVGNVRNSSDDLYSATLTSKTEDGDPATDRFFFSSSLLVLEPVNGSNLTCSGGTGANPVESSTIITLSGIPDSPSDLDYDKTVVIENSVDFRWNRPSYTGGVPLKHYEFTANNETVTVAVVEGSVSVDHSALAYGEVIVTAINFCDEANQPVTLNITAEAPPNFSDSSVEFSCKDTSSPWRIMWMYEDRNPGVVYPNNEVSVKISSDGTTIILGVTACSNLPADETSCTPDLPRGVYNINLTQTNDIGSTVNNLMMDTRVLIVQDEMLEDDKPLSVTLTVNDQCAPDKYRVSVIFGTRPVDGGDCKSQENVTKDLSPGDTEFSVEANVVTRELNEQYCYVVTLDGQVVIEGGGGNSGLSTAAEVAIIVAPVVGFLAFVAVVVVVLIVVIIRVKRNRDKGKSQQAIPLSSTKGPGSPDPDSGEAGLMYQEPSTISRSAHPETGELYTDINLKTKRSEQDPSTIEHQEAASGDVYAMPQKKTGKKGKKGGNGGEPEEEGLTEEEKAALYSVPDRKTQKAKSAGLVYTDVVVQPSSKPAPPPQGSTYADIKLT